MNPPRLRFQITRRDALRGLALTPLVAACKDPDAPFKDGVMEPVEFEAITPNEDFYVTSYNGTPAVDRATWSCNITGLGVDASFDMAFLEGLTARDKEHTLECISAGPTHKAIGNAVWSGLPLSELFEALGVSVPAEAVQILFTCAEDYTTSNPIEDLDLPSWLVWRMNGEPLPEAHGTTVRMLVPGRYGMKNPKWIVEMEFVDAPVLGFWESQGWSDEAPYLPNALIGEPGRGQTVEAGDLLISGTAFAGDDPISSVEVSLDGGSTWTAATLVYQGGVDVWTLWELPWSPEAGDYTIIVRATTESGAKTGSADGSSFPDGYGGGMSIEVRVT